MKRPTPRPDDPERRDALADLFERLGKGRTAAVLDEDRAARGERLAAFVQSEVWRRDLLPLLEKWAEASVQAMTSPNLDALGRAEAAGMYRVSTAVIEFLGGEIQMGRQALRRVVERRLGPGALLPSRGTR